MRFKFSNERLFIIADDFSSVVMPVCIVSNPPDCECVNSYNTTGYTVHSVRKLDW